MTIQGPSKEVIKNPVGFWSLGLHDDSCSADIVDQYIGTIKEKLGKCTGCLLWTGNAKYFLNLPLDRNMVSKVPSVWRIDYSWTPQVDILFILIGGQQQL